MSEYCNHPRIVLFEWGLVTVHDGNRRRNFKDCIVFSGDGNVAENWDWGDCGTRHIPGVAKKAAVLGLQMCNDCIKVIFSTGVNERLKVSAQATDYLRDIGIRYTILQREEALKEYTRDSAEGVSSCLFLHSTC